MIVSSMKMVDGKPVISNMKVVDQASLTSDCWMVQFNGLGECETCEYRGKKSCGGGETLKRLQKEKEEA